MANATASRLDLPPDAPAGGVYRVLVRNAAGTALSAAIQPDSPN